MNIKVIKASNIIKKNKNWNTIVNKDRKREKLSRKYTFSSMLECGFCGKILSRRTWHTSSIYKKVNWQCVRSTKKGKKYLSSLIKIMFPSKRHRMWRPLIEVYKLTSKSDS